jgi:plastocyanin
MGGDAPGRNGHSKEVLMLERRRKALAGLMVVAIALVTVLAITATGSAKSGQKLSLRASPSGALKYSRKTLHAKPGKTTVVMTNPGSSGLKHGIEVEGHGAEKRGKNVGPGHTSTVTIKLKVGTYQFYCPVDGHKAAGMKGKIVVSR